MIRRPNEEVLRGTQDLSGGDCGLCHGLGTVTQSRTHQTAVPRQVAVVIANHTSGRLFTRSSYPLQPWQACDSSRKSDGPCCSRQTGVPGTSPNARFGRIGGVFGRWSSATLAQFVRVCVACSERKTVPRFLRGPFRNALKIAMEEVLSSNDVVGRLRGWKLFVMIPRMLLHRPPGGGVVAKEKLVGRFELFHQGHWTQLIRKRRNPDTDDEDDPGERLFVFLDDVCLLTKPDKPVYAVLQEALRSHAGIHIHVVRRKSGTRVE